MSQEHIKNTKKREYIQQKKGRGTIDMVHVDKSIIIIRAIIIIITIIIIIIIIIVTITTTTITIIIK